MRAAGVSYRTLKTDSRGQLIGDLSLDQVDNCTAIPQIERQEEIPRGLLHRKPSDEGADASDVVRNENLDDVHDAGNLDQNASDDGEDGRNEGVHDTEDRAEGGTGGNFD